MDGIVLGNRYELLEKIGEGGMSEVFKARDNKLNRFVAVKILKNEFCDNPSIVEKFKGEATAIATLSDNNIVNILDVGTQEEINYIVMEYVKGKTLKDIIKQVGKMNYETAISVAVQIAKALDCAHRNNIIHRDVKPQNILVTEDGVMKVTDFGIAKFSSSETITNTSTIMGSAHYLSPEQAKGTFIDCRTDLYSLGVVLYEMVTGRLPFQADTAVTIALKHLQEEVVPPKSINSKVPDSLNQLILKAMEKDPIKRYQTAKEMIADLEKIKEDPNALIEPEDENDHTIIMSAVTEQIPKHEEVKNTRDDEYDDEDDDYYYEEDDDDEKSSGKNKKKIIKIGIVAVLVLVLLGIGVGTYMLKTGSVSSKQVQVPDVTGETVDDATKQLQALNLELVNAGKEASDKPEGTITKMNPDAGTMVNEKSQVRVIVSSGTEKSKMPDFREDTLEQAKTILDSMGLKLDDKNITYDYSDDIPKDEIISQTPKKDADIGADDKITVVVSKGPEVKYVQVPSVKGFDEDRAKSTLSNAGLKASVNYQTTENQTDNGKVLFQSGNDKEKAGTTITITVGSYTPKQEPPATANPGDTGDTGDTKSNNNPSKSGGNTSQSGQGNTASNSQQGPGSTNSPGGSPVEGPSTQTSTNKTTNH
ncbi:Stk1 family PASTA domain-containing Ser/Thr kinase [Clostridium sp. BL-8]|uniref:Stk1 family PASTA domain-containing Ser/Thr kinase n=1 Tax=Clostridium sp. BL-8 TaxID=349938 RepID=UPI00098CDA5B|nr:Stk1 family PASTA domain-containing Ser/Thr kinase [Clostridium sp. BL-8]OOM78268.1 serine/threonine-protein kinase PrkC [Clostridium sp. BL-8]